MDEEELDQRVRLAAFGFLERQVQRYGDALPRAVLLEGFLFEGRRVPLLSPQGIFKPALLPQVPLSVSSVPIVAGRRRPYEDEIQDDGTLRYAYRGTDPFHRDNVGLRLAMNRQAPLVYFHGLVPGRYYAHWPAYVVDDEPAVLRFTIALDNLATSRHPDAFLASEVRRAYGSRVIRQRLHQAEFRVRVLAAYRSSCAMCRLKARRAARCRAHPSRRRPARRARRL